MADNILLKFSADTSGLDQANESYLLLQDRERELLVELKKLDLEYDRQINTIKKKASSQEAMDKKLVGAYADKLLKEKSYRNELEKTRRGLTDFEKSFRQMDNTIATGAVSTKLTRTLRDIREELSRMEMAGDTNSQKFIDLSVKAAQYENQISDTQAQIRALASDTRNLDAAMSLGQGLAGSFTVAQSAAALLGGENETLQKAFFKTQAALQLINGVQMVANTLNKDSVASVILKNALSKKTVAGKTAEATATVANTAATAAETGAVKTATAAQIKWNLSILANPVMWIIAGVGILIGLVAKLASSYKTEAEMHKEAVEATKAWMEMENIRASSAKQESDIRIRALEQELALSKARGASEVQQAILEKNLSERRIVVAKQQYDLLAKSETNIQSLILARDGREHEINRLLQKQNELKVHGKDLNKQQNEQLERAKEWLGIYNERLSTALGAQKELTDAQNAETLRQAEQAEKATQKARSSVLAQTEARLIAARKGSEQEHRIRLEFLEKQKNAALANVNLTEGERRKIIAQYDKDVADEKIKQRNIELTNENALVSARLLVAKKGSAKELSLKLSALEIEKEKALTDANLSAEQRYFIEQEYQNKVNNLKNDARSVEQDAHTAQLEQMLSLSGKGEKEYYDLKREIAESEYKAQIIREDLTQAERLRLLLAFNDKVKAIDKEQAEDRAAQAKTELQNEKTTNLQILASVTSTGYQRAAARKWLKDYDRLLLDQELADLKKRHRDGIKDEIAYQKELARIRGEQAQIELSEYQEKEDVKQEILRQSIQLLMDIGNALFDSKKERLQQEMDDLDEYYTTDADEARKNADKQYITEEELKKKKLKIKRDLAKAEKEQALFNAFVNMATGITVALASAPPPFNAILAAITAAAAMVQIAAIVAKPLPKYWKGRKAGRGELATVGEQGPELMWVPDGAAVIPSHKSRQISEAFSALNYYGIPVPNVPSSAIPTGNGAGFDYDRMGQAVARHVSGSTLNINLDEHGFTKYLETGRSKQQIINSLFSSRL